MPLRFYNTLSHKVEVFRPRSPRKIDIFVCGPTVYDHSHMGHARTYVTFDAIVRYLRFMGYHVRYLVNITDIDDKIIARAKQENANALSIGRRYTKSFLEDMRRLRIKSAPRYAPASKHVPTIHKQIKTLMQKGFAYESGGSVYFSVSKFKNYGKLSRQRGTKLRRAVRIEKDPNKRHPFDFVLWKAEKPGEPSWPSPWGRGRPGWHIEDTAISEHYFGPQYDIHGGAVDLIFPHHESEIAQQEAASGRVPFVRLWLHAGLLNILGQKMSKSLKNFVTIRDMLEQSTAEAFRMLTFRAHYRMPMQYNHEFLQDAAKSVERLCELRDRLARLRQKAGGAVFAKTLRDSLFQRLSSDFDSPGFFADLFTSVKRINAAIDRKTLSRGEAQAILKVLRDIDSIFGVLPRRHLSDSIPKAVKELLALRQEARGNKAWEKADLLRDEIRKAGWIIKDTPSGPVLRRA